MEDKRKNSGFSLIELLVVIGIFTTIAAFSIVVSIDSYRRTLSRSDVETIISMLSKARNQAINNICLGNTCTEGKPHGFHIENGNYIIFQGTTFNSSDPLNESAEASGGLTNLTGITTVTFTQLSGEVVTPGTIVAVDQSGRTFNIEINSEGRINVTNT